jgi:methylsterol monooxygenase
MDYILPHFASLMDYLVALYGKDLALFLATFPVWTLHFWILGGLMLLPAAMQSKRLKIQSNKELDLCQLLRSLPLIILNFLLGYLCSVVVIFKLLPEGALDWHAPPSTNTLLRDIVVWLAVEELVFFYSHRWLHSNKALYQAVHKIHHTWTAPVSWAAIYCHPLEMIASNMAPLLLGPLICGSHAWPTMVYMGMGVLHTMAVHSGYWICDDDGMHDLHHSKFNVNFGMMGVMDYLYGTYQVPARGSVGTQKRD